MKKQKKRLFIISLIAIVGIVYWNSQADIKQYLFSKHVIFWEKNITLKPSDFQGDSNKNSKSKIWWHHALYLKSKNLKDAEVKAVFDKDKSWIKDASNFKANMELQKLSFDMYEAYARKFNKEIDKIKKVKVQVIVLSSVTFPYILKQRQQHCCLNEDVQ